MKHLNLPLFPLITVLVISFVLESEHVFADNNSQSAELPSLAKIEIVKTTYHGIEVADPYRWLENWDDPAVKAFSEVQNKYARSQLNAMPDRDGIHKRISEIMSVAGSSTYSAVHKAGDKLLVLKSDPEKQQAMLMVVNANAETKSERLLVDPNAIDESGSTTIDWYVASHSGDLVAVSMSVGGTESGDIHIYKTSDGTKLSDITIRVNGGTAGGALAWTPDDNGYYYTRYPRKGEKHEDEPESYQRVFYHKLGDSFDKDTYIIGDHFTKISETKLLIDPESGRLVVWVQDGDSNRFEMYMRQTNGSWNKFSEYGDGHTQPVFGHNGDLYIISHLNAVNGKVLLLNANDPDVSKATVLIDESQGAINHSFYSHYSPSMLVTKDLIFLSYQIGGPNQIQVFNLEGISVPGPDQLAVSTAFGLTQGKDNNVYFANVSYLSPTNWLKFNVKDKSTKRLVISSKPTIDHSDVTVVREFVTSKDGVKIPVNILLPKGLKLDGTNPVIVTGYGGYGISITPSFSNTRHLMFENGVIWAQANLRGGSEYGALWHTDGNLTNKQNVFDDFAAVIQHLIKRKYASPDKVGIVGGSNGGLLMGVTMVQNPQLASVVVSHVGIYDSIRSELSPNGAYNIPEFGTVKDASQFAALNAYSPYHNVKDGVNYPPLLLPTGANDPRVDPMHSRKFTARLNAAQNSVSADRRNVLLRTSSNSGHGSSTPLNERIELTTDQYTFLFHHLKVKIKNY